VKDVVYSRSPVEEEEGDGEKNSPEEGDLTEMVMPESGEKKGTESDGKKDTDERDNGP